jgi:hypothetical protein
LDPFSAGRSQSPTRASATSPCLVF